MGHSTQSSDFARFFRANYVAIHCYYMKTVFVAFLHRVFLSWHPVVTVVAYDLREQYQVGEEFKEMEGLPSSDDTNPTPWKILLEKKWLPERSSIALNSEELSKGVSNGWYFRVGKLYAQIKFCRKWCKWCNTNFSSLLVLHLFTRINLRVFPLVTHKPKSQWPLPVIQVLQSLSFRKQN